MKNADKKVLLIGGTGAMGTYLAPELVKRNCLVDVVSLDDVSSDNENLRYFKANAHDDNVRKKLLENGYDVIVDFLIYPTDEFKRVHTEMLSKQIIISIFQRIACTPASTPSLKNLRDFWMCLMTARFWLRKITACIRHARKIY